MNESNGSSFWALNQTRRGFLRTTGFGAATVLMGSTLLAACAPDGSGAPIATGPASDAELELIRTALGVTEKTSGAGTTLRAAYIGPLSGPGQPYSVDQIAGIKSAVKTIAKLGGPSLDVTYLDHKSGDPQAGLSAFREMTSSGIDIMFSTYAGNLFTLIDPVGQNKVFTMDAGGSSPLALGHPYFWNAAPIWTGFFAGTFVHLRKKYPDAKSVTLVAADQGGEQNAAVEQSARESAAANGFSLDKFILASALTEGDPDFGTVLSQVRDAKPDVVVMHAVTNLVGNFMTQYKQAGLTAPVDGGVLNPVDLQVGGAAVDGVTSTATYMFPQFPDNPLARLLVSEYDGEVTNFTPNWNAGFFFQAAINIWELSMLCNAAGIEPTGENLNTQALTSPTLHSPYGGSSTEVGKIAYDSESHIVTDITVHDVTLENGHFMLESTNNLAGSGYQAVSPAKEVA